MAKESLKELSAKMRDLDLCMMTTITKSGMTASRPMSNNGDVKFDGNAYFFSWKKSRLVKDLESNSHVNLAYQGKKRLFVSVTGKAKIIEDKSKMEKHWNPDLDKWFEDGIDTKGVVMIHVKAKRVKYWQDEKESEVKV